MKTSYYKIIAVLLSLSMLLLSCDGDDNCASSRILRLTTKTVESDPDNIKDKVRLYFFDQYDKLEKVINTTLNTEIETAGGKDYTIIAMGYSSDVQEPTIPLGTLIDDAKIILSTTSFGSVNVSPSSGDIFYGQLILKKEDRFVDEIIWLKRKVAALTIITKNLQPWTHTTDEDFNYVVRETKGTLDFRGNFNGDKVAYKPNSSFNSDKQYFIAPVFYTYASTDESMFYIDLYKGNTLIQTHNLDKSLEPQLLNEGKHTIVFIELPDQGVGSKINVTITVKDWIDGTITEGF